MGTGWRQITAICGIGLVFVVLGAGASFNFGITPDQTDEGVQNPGDRFFTSFNVVSGQEEGLEVTIDTTTAGVDDFKAMRGEAAANYSEQPCQDCVEFLTGGGELQDYNQDSNINQWRRVEFFVDVPEDAEPGYHMVQVQPQPTRSSGSGSVGVVSSTAFPVIFRVPGTAVRSATILGVHAGQTYDNRQRIVATLYNAGTVTVTTRTELRVPTVDGNRTVQTGSSRLAPGETDYVTGRIATDELAVENGTFPVYAETDYSTGTDTFSTQLSPRDPVQTVTAQTASEPTPSGDRSALSYLLIIAALLVTTGITVWVVRYDRY